MLLSMCACDLHISSKSNYPSAVMPSYRFFKMEDGGNGVAILILVAMTLVWYVSVYIE